LSRELPEEKAAQRVGFARRFEEMKKFDDNFSLSRQSSQNDIAAYDDSSESDYSDFEEDISSCSSEQSEPAFDARDSARIFFQSQGPRRLTNLEQLKLLKMKEVILPLGRKRFVRRARYLRRIETAETYDEDGVPTGPALGRGG